MATFHKGSYVISTRCSDSSIIELWLGSQRSPLTRECYQRDAQRLLAHARKPLNRIGLGDVQAFAQSLVDAGLAPISRARVIAAVKSLYGFCQRMHIVGVNPAAELPLPRYQIQLAERLLPEDAVQRVLEAPGAPRDRVLLQTLYVAGLRVSEACGLRWRNLSATGDAGQLTVFGKSGRTRTVALTPELWNSLNKLRKSAESGTPVFCSRSGQPLDRGRVRAILRTAAETARLLDKTPKLSPHWLRHAHATHALDHGAPIHLVQATLGHTSVATTSAYLHARPGDSSARYLPARIFLPNSAKSALLSARNRVMDVIDAGLTAKGAKAMTSNESVTGAPEAATAAVKDANATKPAKKAPKKAPAAPQEPRVAPAKGKSGKKATPAKKAPKGAKGAKAHKSAKPADGARQGSKTAKVMELLKRPDGATLVEIMKATNWQAHSVRGFISGTLGKKMDLPVASVKNESGDRVYRIEK